MNNVEITGKLGNWNPERNSFGIGIPKKNKDGEWSTTWISCRAVKEAVAQVDMLDKDGIRYIHVNGFLSVNEWLKDEQKKKEVIVVATKIAKLEQEKNDKTPF